MKVLLLLLLLGQEPTKQQRIEAILLKLDTIHFDILHISNDTLKKDTNAIHNRYSNTFRCN